MAGLLAQQRVEQRQHCVWQKAGAAGDHKDAEPEQIEAFAIAEIDKVTIGIRARRIERALVGADAVAADHQSQKIGMAGFLEALQRHRLADDRVGDRRGIGVDDRSRTPLGEQHLRPERDRAPNRSRADASSSGQARLSGR